MQIEKASIEELLPDPANVRNHSSKNLESIKASLVTFGQQKPIVVNRDNVVIAGNGTFISARELGWQAIDIVRTDLTGAEATAFAIADNRTAELAQWDDASLASVLSALSVEDQDLDENLTTDHKCPKCDYEWSGSSK